MGNSIGLFCNQILCIMDLKETADTIEGVLVGLGLDPENARDRDEENVWQLKFGNSNFRVETFTDEQNWNYFQVFAPLGFVPENVDGDFYEHLLNTNGRLFESTFCMVNNNLLIVKGIRETYGLDEIEIKEMILRIGGYADEFKEEYKEVLTSL